MALKSIVPLESGLTLTDAYIKVTGVKIIAPVSGSKKAAVNVNVYADEDSRVNGRPEVCAFTHEASGDDFIMMFDDSVLAQQDTTPISQAYVWIKTLPFYVASTDVVDEKD